MNRKFALASLGGAAAVTAAIWLLWGQADPGERYKTHTVAAGAVTQTVAANGTLNPVTVVSVGTQVSGTVRQLFVDFNSKVEQGQPLLELDNTLYAAQAAQSAASLKNAEANLELALANERRLAPLFDRGVASRQSYDQALQARKSAAAQLALARATVAKDQATLGFTVIRSPISGIVVDRVVDVGQTVAASFQTPTLIRIAQDLAKMQIDANFAEADIGFIKLGQKVRFNVDALPNRSFQGEVQQIRLNPVTVQNVVTYDVVVGVDNSEQLLLPGMTAYVTIAVAERKDALLVPNAALRYKPGKSATVQKPADAAAAADKGEARRKDRRKDAGSGVVHVLDGAVLRPVPVTLGITDNRNTEVTGDALKPGDVVVVGETAADAPVSSGGGTSPLRARLF